MKRYAKLGSIDLPMKMRETSRVQDKKLAGNNNLGRALKFYSSVRIEMRKGEPIKNGSAIIGNKAKVKIVKNKVAIPFKSCEVDLIYGEGFSLENEIVEMAVKKDIIHKAGSWFSYKDIKIGQGAESVKAWLKANPDMKEKIMSEIHSMSSGVEFDEETGEVIE